MNEPTAQADVKVHAAEIWISNILRTGVWISLIVIAIGMAVTFTRHPDYRTTATSLPGLTDATGQAVPHSIADVIDGLKAFRGRAIIELGLLMLIATPVVRVAASVVVFTSLKDRKFIIITLAVLTLLLVSFWLGGADS
ncbi:MAG: DUF1634 domain-containing protein [Tepidisphaeraceae bacterium]